MKLYQLILLVFVIIGSLLFVSYKTTYGTQDYVKNVKVTQVGQTSGEDWKYLVYSDNEVFQNTDSLWFGKWNSSDFQARIKSGKVYNFHVTGWRVPFLSWYRNIVSYEEVK